MQLSLVHFALSKALRIVASRKMGNVFCVIEHRIRKRNRHTVFTGDVHRHGFPLFGFKPDYFGSTGKTFSHLKIFRFSHLQERSISDNLRQLKLRWNP